MAFLATGSAVEWSSQSLMQSSESHAMVGNGSSSNSSGNKHKDTAETRRARAASSSEAATQLLEAPGLLGRFKTRSRASEAGRRQMGSDEVAMVLVRNLSAGLSCDDFH